MIALLLELNVYVQLATLWLLAWLDRRGLFVQPLTAMEFSVLAAMWPIGLLYIAAEWRLTSRGYR